MVRIKGPAASLDAAGHVGGVLIFSKNKGRSYAKKFAIPTQPNSPAQIAQKAMHRFTTDDWKNVTPAVKQQWEQLAEQLNLSTYHAYLKFNSQRWSQGLTPTRYNPPLPYIPAGAGPSQTSVARLRTVLITPTIATLNANNGVIIHHSTSTGFTPSARNAVAAIRYDNFTQETYVHGPLPSGTHYYRVTPFAIAGAAGSPSAETSAVIP